MEFTVLPRINKCNRGKENSLNQGRNLEQIQGSGGQPICHSCSCTVYGLLGVNFSKGCVKLSFNDLTCGFIYIHGIVLF